MEPTRSSQNTNPAKARRPYSRRLEDRPPTPSGAMLRSRVDVANKVSPGPADYVADAEAELVVSLYFDGYTLTKVGEMLGRPASWVSSVFHSPVGKLVQQRLKRTRNELAAQIQERVAYAAQGALDEIITLAQGADSEAVRLHAAQDLVDRSGAGAPVARGGIQVTIHADAMALAVQAIREVDKYTEDT